VNDLGPNGTGQRILRALALLFLVAIGTRFIADELEPFIPSLVVITSFGVIFRVVFGRRRK